MRDRKGRGGKEDRKEQQKSIPAEGQRWTCCLQSSQEAPPIALLLCRQWQDTLTSEKPGPQSNMEVTFQTSQKFFKEAYEMPQKVVFGGIMLLFINRQLFSTQKNKCTLETFKVRLQQDLSTLIVLQVSLFSAGELDQVTFKGPF